MERVPNESVEIPKNCSPVLGTSVPGELLIPVAASPASGEKEAPQTCHFNGFRHGFDVEGMQLELLRL